jgi:hypothetical protein
MGPDGTRNQEWLSLRRPAAIYPTDRQCPSRAKKYMITGPAGPRKKMTVYPKPKLPKIMFLTLGPDFQCQILGTRMNNWKDKPPLPIHPFMLCFKTKTS